MIIRLRPRILCASAFVTSSCSDFASDRIDAPIFFWANWLYPSAYQPHDDAGRDFTYSSSSGSASANLPSRM